jgi:hypothetical protein
VASERAAGHGVGHVELHRRKGRCGRPSKLNDDVKQVYRDVLQEAANNYVTLSYRAIMDGLEHRGVKIGLATAHRHLHALNVTNRTLHVQPSLSEEQRLKRMSFILAQADRSHGRSNFFFKDSKNVVHVDETWFTCIKEKHVLKIIAGVEIPKSLKVTHKSHIMKVMFLVAMAQPQDDPAGVFFDGKIGIWPCVVPVTAKNSSKNRAKGTVSLVPKNVTADYYRELMIGSGGVFERIKQRMHWLRDVNVVVQHDGARPHTGNDNVEQMNLAGAQDGWNITVVTQPPNSPDLNILDLGLFHSLKTQFYNRGVTAQSMQPFVDGVVEEYEKYKPQTLLNIWAEQYAVWNAILRVQGENDYELPHTQITKKARRGENPIDRKIDVDAYNMCFQIVNRSTNSTSI